MNSKQILRPSLTLIAAALLAIPAARAQEADKVTRLTQPESSIRVGFAHFTGEFNRYGQYRGLDENGYYGLLDVDLVRRDDASGTWLTLTGRDLGLDTRELRFDHQRQGNWRYFIDYSETPRLSQYTVNTGLRGLDSNNLTVSAAGKRDTHPQTERQAFTIGVDKFLDGNWDLRLRFRNEDKDGTRIFGRGTTTGPVWQYLAEPIDSTTRQVDLSLAYTDAQLQLVAGYYGAFYDNANQWLNVGPGLACTAANSDIRCFTPLALPPDNQSHQFNLTGGYNFSKTTRANFKFAYARATQDESFAGVPFTTVRRSDLGGEVVTTQLQAGFTTQPVDKLTVVGNLRYDDKDDQTPVAKYFGNPGGVAIPAGSTLDGGNEPRSLRTINGRLDASYPLAAGFRLTAGVEYDQKERNTGAIRAVSHRDKVDETSLKLDVRRALGDTVTGAFSFIHADRNGSDYYLTTRTGGAVGSNLIAPIHTADRVRDKLRATVDWQSSEALSLQFIVDHAFDDYSMSRSILGVDEGESRFYSADASYRFSEAWQFHAWASSEDGRVRQSTVVGAAANGAIPATGPVWSALLRTDNDAFGFGVNGKPTTQLDLGANLEWSDDRYAMPISRVRGTTALPTALPPDIFYTRTTIKLFGAYALKKNMGIRADLIHDRLKTDDWTWSQWTYTAASDGTRVAEKPLQKSNFVGVSAYYKWW